LDALSSLTVVTTTNYGLWTSKSSKNALDELLSQTGGDVHDAVLRARLRSSQAKPEDQALSGTVGALPRGHVVGRWISGQDTAGVPAMVVESLGSWRAREEAEIRTRNSPYLGSK